MDETLQLTVPDLTISNVVDSLNGRLLAHHVGYSPRNPFHVQTSLLACLTTSEN
jgi:hypothetical protein